MSAVLTAAEFATPFPGGVGTRRGSLFLAAAVDSRWLVRFRYELRGEAPEIAQETVTAGCEASAIKAAITARLGGTHAPLRALQVLAVHRIESRPGFAP